MTEGATRPLVLVDGSNVARCASWRARLDPAVRADLAAARRRLVDGVASWAGLEGVDVVLAFDGSGPWRAGRTNIAPGIDVVGSGSGRSGDELLEHHASDAARSGRPYWIVTSDRALADTAGARADLVIDADSFVEQRLAGGVGAGGGSAGPGVLGSAQAEASPPPTAPGLRALVDPEVAERLERLRRGEIEP